MAEFIVKCNVCNDTLDADFSGSELYVDPCEKCLDEAKDEGYMDREAEVQGTLA